MGDVIGLILAGVGAVLVWIGVHIKEGSLSDMISAFAEKIRGGD